MFDKPIKTNDDNEWHYLPFDYDAKSEFFKELGFDDDMLSYLCENIFTIRISVHEKYIKKNRKFLTVPPPHPDYLDNQINIQGEQMWFVQSIVNFDYITHAKQKYNRKKILKYL